MLGHVVVTLHMLKTRLPQRLHPLPSSGFYSLTCGRWGGTRRIKLPSGDRAVCVGVLWGGRRQAPAPWHACGSPARPLAGRSSGKGQ